VGLTEYYFDQEPCGEQYRVGLRAMLTISDVAQLIVVDQHSLMPKVHAFLDRLRPWLVDEVLVSSWPGTLLGGPQALRYRYRVDVAFTEILVAAADGLYGWRHRDLPEDPALFRGDGSLVMGVIAHERDAWVTVTPDELDTVSAVAPAWVRLLRPAHST